MGFAWFSQQWNIKISNWEGRDRERQWKEWMGSYEIENVWDEFTLQK